MNVVFDIEDRGGGSVGGVQRHRVDLRALIARDALPAVGAARAVREIIQLAAFAGGRGLVHARTREI